MKKVKIKIHSYYKLFGLFARKNKNESKKNPFIFSIFGYAPIISCKKNLF